MLEYLKYGFLPGILQPGFPATPSATGWGHFQPVAVNRAVSSHPLISQRALRNERPCRIGPRTWRSRRSCCWH